MSQKQVEKVTIRGFDTSSLYEKMSLENIVII